MNKGLIANSINFPDYCLGELTTLLGETIAAHIKDILDEEVSVLIKAFDTIFESRRSSLQDAPDEAQRRFKQIQCHNPSQISSELRNIIEHASSGDRYIFFADTLKENVEIGVLANRYLLSRKIYSQIIQSGFHSLSGFTKPLQDLSSAINDQVVYLKKFQETRYLRTGATIAAAIAGGMLGRAGGHLTGRIGSRLAGRVVGNLLGNSAKLETSAGISESAFRDLEKSWDSIKNTLQAELRCVIYTAFGGLLLRLVKDLQHLGKTVTELDFNTGALVVSLNDKNRNNFLSWASETRSGIESLVKNRDFNAASLASYRAMQYCLENGSRMVELYQDRSFVLIFQDLFIFSSDIVAAEMWATGKKGNALDYWMVTVNRTPFFPDNSEGSLFQRAISISSGCLKHENSELVAKAIILINSINALYARRFLAMAKPNGINFIPAGESYNYLTTYLLSLQENENLLGQSENTNTLSKAIKETSIDTKSINRTSLAWIWQAIVTVRAFDPLWSNTLTRCLIRKFAKKVGKIVAISVLTIGTVTAISAAILFPRTPPPVQITNPPPTETASTIPPEVTLQSPVDQIKSEMMDKYYAFHETKSYAEWDEKDMEKAVDLLAHPVTDADIKSFQDDEKSTLNLECSTGSCLIHQREFTAAKMIREGKAKTAQEALGFDSKPADVSVHQQQTTTPSQVIESLLNAARADNIPRDIGEQAILSNLPKPGRGNRKVAREKNTAGLIALNTSNYKVAIALFAEGATFDQSDIEITNNLGYALMMDDQLEAAKAKLVDVLSLDISRSGAWANLGDVFAKIGSQEKAVAAFKLSYYFSRAPEKTIEFFKKHSEADRDEKIRNASAIAIAAFPNIQPMIASLPVSGAPGAR